MQSLSFIKHTVYTLLQMGIRLPQSPRNEQVEKSIQRRFPGTVLLICLVTLSVGLRCQTTRHEHRRQSAAEKELSSRTVLTSRSQSTYANANIAFISNKKAEKNHASSGWDSER